MDTFGSSWPTDLSSIHIRNCNGSLKTYRSVLFIRYLNKLISFLSRRDLVGVIPVVNPTVDRKPKSTDRQPTTVYTIIMSDEAAGLAVQQNKKPKTMEDAYPMAPQSEWPEAWIMKNENNDDDAFDQCQPNRCEPNIPMSAQELQTIGIAYWRMDDVDKYDYPVKAVPYDPKSASDPKLSALRDSRGYSYADIITVHPDHLPEFELKIKAFFEEVSGITVNQYYH